MTEQQLSFDALLRASEIELSKEDAALAFDLAKELIKNPNMGLIECAEIFCKHKPRGRQKTSTPQPKKPRDYTMLTISPCHCDWPKAC